MRLFLTIAFLLPGLFCTVCTAQTSSYPRGTYYSLEELRQRSPSGPYAYELARAAHLKDSNSSVYSTAYKVLSLDSAISKKTLRKEVFAISSGDTLYVNGAQFGKGSSYLPIDEVADVLIFEHGIKNQAPVNNSAVAAGIMFGAVGAAIAIAADLRPPKMLIERYLYLLDPETGKAQKTDNLTFETWLNRDNLELLRVYQNEPLKTNDVMKEYIEKWRTGLNSTEIPE